MVAKRIDARGNTGSTPRRPPAPTPEAREMQMISYAVDLAERQMLEGTASAQVITHYLKLASSRNALETKKIERENKLLDARVKQIDESAQNGDLYQQVIQAMKEYTGEEVDRPYDF